MRLPSILFRKEKYSRRKTKKNKIKTNPNNLDVKTVLTRHTQNYYVRKEIKPTKFDRFVDKVGIVGALLIFVFTFLGFIGLLSLFV